MPLAISDGLEAGAGQKILINQKPQSESAHREKRREFYSRIHDE